MDPPPHSALPVDSPRTVDANNADALSSAGAKIRLMCSYGGHIMPRPHDKALSYVGGETRLVVIDRHSSFSSLTSRLSRTLLNGRPFTLKYQLPDEDLDSLVSITADEDLENMMEEYDRVSSSSSNARIRLFLFASKLETAATMGSLLDDPKSESWFVDALNGSGLLSRGFSDSVMENCLVNLVEVVGAETQTVDENGGREPKRGEGAFRNVAQGEVQLSSLPDSPMVETSNSSFGSSSSTPSMANLPPIRVRINEQQRMEEQFAQMSFSNAHRQVDDGTGAPPLRPPVVAPVAMADAVAVAVNGGAGEVSGNPGWVLSDDERSDPGRPVGYRKPPLPLQPVVVQPRLAGGYNLPSPDSVTSDSSIASANSLPKPSQSDPPITTSQIPVQQVQFAGAATLDLPPPPPPPPQHLQPLQTQPLIPPSVHFVPQPSAPAATRPPLPQYYPVYAHPVDHPQQYPVYVMPVSQSQPYVSLQAQMGDPHAMASSRPIPAVIPSSGTPPLYPAAKPPAPATPETPAAVYRSAVPPNPQVVHIPLSQFHSQYTGFTQVPPHPQAAANSNHRYEYKNEMNEQAYYSQVAVPMASQYQSMTPAAAAAAVADASQQLPVESAKQQMLSSPSP